MLSNIEKKLKQIAKVNPLTKAEKNLLWAKIENNLKQNQFSTFFNLKPKFAFASIMATILIIGSAATVAASNNAKPGDILYPVDLAVEKVQLAFTRGKRKDVLRIQFAQERLDEARIVLAFAESDNDFDIANTTSTEQRGPNFQRIKKANNALNVALENLEKTKNILEEKGNAVAAVAINGIIGELTELAEEHVADLDDFEAGIKNNGKTKTEINNFRNNLKIKFNLNFNNNNQKGAQGLEKVAICHIPSGDPDNAHTIVIARAAVQSHLDHGDILGPCGGQATSTPDTTAPNISNISSSVATNTADIIWNTDELSNSKAWYSTTTPMVLDSSLSVELTNLVASHAVSLSNLDASTTYYFVVGSTDSSGNQATSTESSFTTLTPDTTAPVISNINFSVAINTAEINWDTDEDSDSVVWYSTTTPLTISGNTLFVDSSSLVTAHNISLSGLSANTTYYFIVSSLDSFGNKATSIEYSFTTSTPDTTAPNISNISSSAATNTADIIWNTDELSNSKAWYSTTTPMVLDSSLSVELTNLVASHSVSLSSLNASTTYYFVVGSTDSSGNQATSTESSFTTL